MWPHFVCLDAAFYATPAGRFPPSLPDLLRPKRGGLLPAQVCCPSLQFAIRNCLIEIMDWIHISPLVHISYISPPDIHSSHTPLSLILTSLSPAARLWRFQPHTKCCARQCAHSRFLLNAAVSSHFSLLSFEPVMHNFCLIFSSAEEDVSNSAGPAPPGGPSAAG